LESTPREAGYLMSSLAGQAAEASTLASQISMHSFQSHMARDNGGACGDEVRLMAVECIEESNCNSSPSRSDSGESGFMSAVGSNKPSKYWSPEGLGVLELRLGLSVRMVDG
jgi:hypothetical protein